MVFIAIQPQITRRFLEDFRVLIVPRMGGDSPRGQRVFRAASLYVYILWSVYTYTSVCLCGYLRVSMIGVWGDKVIIVNLGV